MEGLQKIGFVSIILLIGLFSLQLSLKKQDYLKYPPQSDQDVLKAETVDHSDDLKDYQGPLIFPADTIRKYYKKDQTRNLIL